GTTRTGWSTRSTTVGRPCGSWAVVTTPAGLYSRTYVSGCRSRGRPSSSTRSPRPTWVFSCAASPLTVTRPALISSSALRREATPARASHALRRMARSVGLRLDVVVVVEQVVRIDALPECDEPGVVRAVRTADGAVGLVV